MLLGVNRLSTERSFGSLATWAQQMLRHLHAKGILFEVWSPISNNGSGAWQVMKQPAPTVFHKDRYYRLHSRDGVHIHLGVSNVHPVRNVAMSQITSLDNTIAVGVEEKTAYIIKLEVKN